MFFRRQHHITTTCWDSPLTGKTDGVMVPPFSLIQTATQIARHSAPRRRAPSRSLCLPTSNLGTYSGEETVRPPNDTKQICTYVLLDYHRVQRPKKRPARSKDRNRSIAAIKPDPYFVTEAPHDEGGGGQIGRLDTLISGLESVSFSLQC